MIFELLYAVIWIVLFFLGIRAKVIFKNNVELNILTGFGFLIKSIATMLLILIYQKFAPSSNLFVDSIAYMNDTAQLNQVFKTSPVAYFKLLTGIGETNDLVLKHLSETNLWDAGSAMYNDSKNVVRFNSLIYFLSQGNIFVHVVFMSFFSTLGIRLLVVSFKNYVSAYKTLFFVLLFLIPSVFISTGGVLKEPFLILGIGLFLNAILAQNSSKLKWITLCLGLVLLISIKPYTFFIILLALSFYPFSKFLFPSRTGISLMLFFITIVLLFLSVKPIRNNTIRQISKKQLDMERIANGGLYALTEEKSPKHIYFRIEDLNKVLIENDSFKIIAPVQVGMGTEDIWEDFNLVEMQPSDKKWKILALFPQKATSYFHTTPIRNSTSKFLLAIPEAFVNGLLRPFPFDSGSSYIYPAMLEVYFCIGMLIFAIINRKKLTDFEKRIIGALLIFIVFSLILVGFTTPVIGALVRYRISAYIALIIISFILFKIPEKWKNRIQ